MAHSYNDLSKESLITLRILEKQLRAVINNKSNAQSVRNADKKNLVKVLKAIKKLESKNENK